MFLGPDIDFGLNVLKNKQAVFKSNLFRDII